jgi:hypothetical protein
MLILLAGFMWRVRGSRQRRNEKLWGLISPYVLVRKRETPERRVERLRAVVVDRARP